MDYTDYDFDKIDKLKDCEKKEKEIGKILKIFAFLVSFLITSLLIIFHHDIIAVWFAIFAIIIALHTNEETVAR